jgi:NADH dehydrogenase
VIGGGFAGVFAIRRLKHAPVDITLVDRSTTNLFQPLLYQAATGLLSEGQISQPLRTMFADYPHVEVLQGKATDVDPDARVVTFARSDASTFTREYDYLIVATGMRQSYFGNDHFAPLAPGMKTLDDALDVRRRIFEAFENAESRDSAQDRHPWLTFAVVGAGPTGVELAGQIRELATKTIHDEFHHIDPAEARVHLFDGLDAPLAPFGEHLSKVAAATLEGLGVELHMRAKVVDLDADGLVVEHDDGTTTRFETKTILWTAGVRAVPFVDRLAQVLGAAQDRTGRISVDEHLNPEGHPEVFVLGDIMAYQGLPGVAEVALQSGMYAGRRIKRLVAGEQPDKAFRYHDVGSAAYISRYRAVVKFRRLEFAGLPAWLVWGAIHLAFLTTSRHRFSTVTSWMFSLLREARVERASLRSTRKR